eukprot:GHRR01036728.1.p1 GENE.GHRR01036728.1~~GHRR01036728.1.p1  ORF type:complete len:150 (+),score=25.71 GHRR01036728.1:430-879(+)
MSTCLIAEATVWPTQHSISGRATIHCNDHGVEVRHHVISAVLFMNSSWPVMDNQLLCCGVPMQALSNLSPYLHYGQLAPQRAALEAVRHRTDYKQSVEGFLEELVSCLVQGLVAMLPSSVAIAGSASGAYAAFKGSVLAVMLATLSGCP